MLRPSTSRPSRRLTALAAVTLVLAAGCSSTAPDADRDSTPASSTSVSTPAPSTTAAPSTTRPASRTSAVSMPAEQSQQPTMADPSTSARAQTASSTRLPLRLSTGNAGQVVTVTSGSASSTTATVKRWTKSGTGWRQVGAAVDAYVGSGGIGSASEGSTRTPAGSWTLTEAFGRDADPGTALPYFRTTPADYWMSSPGPRYNTHQRCSSCGYDNGVNEKLNDITPEYDYAAVIDYNTRNAPGGVRAGAGSAFFLHIANGAPTAGCVAIPRDDLVRVLTWLQPARHPRILIGTT